MTIHYRGDSGGKSYALSRNIIITPGLPVFFSGNITSKVLSIFNTFTLLVAFICYTFSVWGTLFTTIYIFIYKFLIWQSVIYNLTENDACHSFHSVVFSRLCIMVLRDNIYDNAYNRGMISAMNAY